MKDQHDRTPEGPPQAVREPTAGATWELLTREDGSDRRALRIGLAVAVGLHMALLAANFPALTRAEPIEPPDEREVYVVQDVQLKPPPPPPPEEEPPPPPPEQEAPPKPEARKVPVPDRTPDEPEPVVPEPEPVIVPERITPVEAPPLELPELPVEIPAPPPPPPEPEGPIRVGGDVSAPVKIHAPDPVYTETARNARIQGTVILEAIIDKQGNVDQVKVIKGLPMGLDGAAVEAVRKWKFEPGRRAGQPVDVIYNLTVHFRVQ